MMKINIDKDGNCLFRAFAQFVYDEQDKHQVERNEIVSNIGRNWSKYRNFVANNNHMDDVSAYCSYMSTDSVFVEIHTTVNVVVYINSSDIPKIYGCGDFPNKLILYFTGTLDNGDYDILDYDNLQFLREKKLRCHRNYYLRKKEEINDRRNVQNLTPAQLSLNVNEIE